MTTIADYPSTILLGQSFAIDVESAPTGWSYGVFDQTSGVTLASGVVEASNFEILCSGLSGSTGPHLLTIYFILDINNIQTFDVTIDAVDSTFSVTVNPAYNGALFQSIVTYWFDVAISNDTKTVTPADQTWTLSQVYLPPSIPIEVGQQIRVRSAVGLKDTAALNFGNSYWEGTITAYDPVTKVLSANWSQATSAPVTSSSWVFDFGQPKYDLGEYVSGIYPVTVSGTTATLTYSQVDIGNGLLPSWLTLNSSTGEITGKVPEYPIPLVESQGAATAAYDVGISVSDGISTQVVTWTFGGATGFSAAGITDPIVRSATYSVPVGNLYPEGKVQLLSYNKTTGITYDNGYTTLGAGGGGFNPGGGTLTFLTPTAGQYIFIARCMAFEGAEYYVDRFIGGSITPVTERVTGSITVYESLVVLTTVTNTATYRINQEITPLTIATGSGGSYPLTYRIVGYQLPEGLILNTSTGVITGTPTTYGNPDEVPGTIFPYGLVATDGVRDSNTVLFDIEIQGPLATTTVIPNSIIIVGVPVSLTPVTASNAVGSTTWSINPSIPAGLTFNTTNGQIFGTALGTSSFTAYAVTVTDTEGQISTSTFNLTINTSNLATNLAVSNLTLSVNVGMTPSIPVTHTGGYGVVTYSISPSLPAGLVFDTSNGRITGTPITVQGSAAYTITVRDDAGQSSGQTFSITVLDQLSIVVLDPVLAFARGDTIGAITPVTAAGGVPPYSYSITPSLPTGLAFNSGNGEISGTPTISSTTTNYTVTVSDSNARSVIGTFSLKIEPLVVEATSSTLIRAVDYNDIRSLTEEILGIGETGYGYQGIKSLATATTRAIVRWREWSNLLDDVNVITAHQTGEFFTYTTASSVTAEFVNQLVTNLNQAEPNRYLLPPQNTTGTTSSVWTSTYTVDWGTEISTTATFTWPEGFNINYFFNLGGRISFELDYLPSAPSEENLGWQHFINANQSLINDFVYDIDNFSSGSINTSTTSVTGTISLSVVKANNTLTCSIELANDLVGAVDLQVRGTVLYTYSDSILKAPLPREIDLKAFNTGTFTPVILPTKILRLIATPNTYNWNVPNSSTVRTITLQNIGNQPVSVSTITFVDNANVDRIVNGVINGTIGALTVSTTTPYTFSLAYTGTTVGNFESSFTVNSDNDAGAITTSTIQIVSEEPFNFTISPPSVSISYNSPSLWSQSFVIDANRSFENYTAELTAGASNFIIDTTPASGPIIRFNPIGKPSATYPATLSITVNGLTKTASISIALTAIPSSNLGSWLSPQTSDLSVMGMSYDVIANERYLTIGLTTLASPFLSLNDLGVDADDAYKTGLQTFPAQVSSRWNSFLQSLAVWPAPTQEDPVNINVGRTATYRFEAPVTGTYTYEYSSDDDSSFAIDYIALPNQLLTGGSQSNWNRSYTGSISLEAGTHILTYYHINYGGPAGAAFQIKDPSGNVVWNTKYPIRTGQVYGFWKEVYRFRIPANGTPVDLYSSQWCIKDTFNVDGKYYWGEFFAGDMFKITDDGFGNLDINFFGTPRAVPTSTTNASFYNNVIKFMPYLFYYYLPNSFYSASGASITRVTNLDTGPAGDGTQTRYFSGFNQNGAVRTVLRSIPTSAPALPAYTPGGGGGGGGRPPGGDDGRLLPY